MKLYSVSEFWPRWRHRQECFTSSHSQKKDNNQFKNKKQSELPENQTAWKSNNQGVKETFIQIVGGSETGSERTQGKARQQTMETSPHYHLDKLGGTTGGQDRL